MNNSDYCIITGASEGFGRALALECASRSKNLILVALPGPELWNLADQIKSRFSVQVICIEKDLTVEQNCIDLYNEIHAMGIPINTLINNAGIGSTFEFSTGSIHIFQQQIKLNILATTLLTRLFIEKLKNQQHAYILNVSSLSCFFYLAKKQVYGGTKSFIYYFSKSLRNELKKQGISVSVICPGAMNTNASIKALNKQCSWLGKRSVMEPEEVATIAINGMLQQKAVIIPGKLNSIFLFINKLIPTSLKLLITNWQMKKLDSNTLILTHT